MKEPPFHVVIPARYGASRFPGKALASLGGRSVLEHVWGKASASGAVEVLIATDDERIAKAAEGFGAQVVMTATEHRSGTERTAEVAHRRGWAEGEVIVNLQGDAPLVPPACIDQVAALLAVHPSAAMATLCVPIDNEADWQSPHVVKVVCDMTGRALYFSRAPIPAQGHAGQPDATRRAFPDSARHLGLYAYRVGALRALAAAPHCYLEECESLEQLRALWMGLEIRVARAVGTLGPDIDTPQDLERAARHLAQLEGRA
jgi:3-deoxy-manno-octulosonate cytidylyltransferase (CMP-KDO synthetase)